MILYILFAFNTYAYTPAFDVKPSDEFKQAIAQDIKSIKKIYTKDKEKNIVLVND